MENIKTIHHRIVGLCKILNLVYTTIHHHIVGLCKILNLVYTQAL